MFIGSFRIYTKKIQILFAGGATGGSTSIPVSMVDRYNYDTGLWDFTVISSARMSMAAVSLGNMAFFAGMTKIYVVVRKTLFN